MYIKTCFNSKKEGEGQRPGMLIIVSAPSGAGKTTLVNNFFKEYQQACQGTCLVACPRSRPVERVITYTTREPRLGEVDGVDYCFISATEFEARCAEGFFIEWSMAYGTYYGTAASIMARLDAGISLLAVLDRSGARILKDKVSHVHCVGIHVPHVDILEARLRERGGATEEQVAKRLALACQEIEEERVCPLFDTLILNKDLIDAQKAFNNVVKELLMR